MTSLVLEERAERPQGWQLFAIFKKLIGLVMVISLFKMILFPATAPPSDAELLDQAKKSIKLSESDLREIMKSRSAEAQ